MALSRIPTSAPCKRRSILPEDCRRRLKSRNFFRAVALETGRACCLLLWDSGAGCEGLSTCRRHACLYRQRPGRFIIEFVGFPCFQTPFDGIDISLVKNKSSRALPWLSFDVNA